MTTVDQPDALRRSLGNLVDTFGTFLSEGIAKRKQDSHGCGCGCCEEDSCGCHCCIGPADIVLYMRLGESRILPINVRNSRNRPKTVQVSLSEFTCGASSGVVVRGSVNAKDVEIKPCSEIPLVVRVAATLSDGREENDVTNCVVCYADLKLDGCTNHPTRIAVAILPRNCDSYEVECGECCCA